MRPASSLRRLIVILGLLLAARARAITIEVSPAHPTTADIVQVTVGGGFAMSCWPLGALECAVVSPDTLSVVLPVNYCNGAPACFCTLFPVTYTRTCSFGPLPAGSYVARFIEAHVNPADFMPTATVSAGFTVSTVTPARRWSWSRVKSFYR